MRAAASISESLRGWPACRALLVLDEEDAGDVWVAPEWAGGMPVAGVKASGLGGLEGGEVAG